MMEFQESWRPEPEPGDQDPKVLVVTAERLPLEVRPVDSVHVDSDSEVCLGAHFRDRLIARSAVPLEQADLVQELLQIPAQLGLLAEEQDDDGVEGSLVALLPPNEARGVIRQRELAKEPWKASLESQSYEEAKDGEQPVLVPLGRVVRIATKRVSPGDLHQEAADMLKNLVTQGGREVVDDLLDEVP